MFKSVYFLPILQSQDFCTCSPGTCKGSLSPLSGVYTGIQPWVRCVCRWGIQNIGDALVSYFKLPLNHQSPTFLAPGTGFMEDNFSTDRGRGDGFGMFQEHYIYCALYFYYYYIVIYNEIIKQLTIMQNQCKLWACFSATRWSHLGVMGDSDTWSVLLMSSLLHNLVLVAVTAENPASQRKMLEMEAGFSVLLWQSQDILLWL